MFGLLLTAALALTGVDINYNTPVCDTNPDYMGEYVPEDKSITVCEGNLAEKGHVNQFVVKHEAVHAIHHNLGWLEETVIPEPLLTWLVRALMTDGEVLGVIINYSGESGQEFDARILSNLPADVIGLLLLVSAL